MNETTTRSHWLRFSLAVLGAGLATATTQGCDLTQQCRMAGDDVGDLDWEDEVPPTADANRAILEADIVQVVGDRLYALSSHAGLSIVDVSDPAELTLLGQARTDLGRPFEMYVLDGRVVSIAESVEGSHVSTVQTFWVANPATVRLLGVENVAGHVSDSRIVGDVLYVVSFEDHVCGGCPVDATTSITSFQLAGGGAAVRVDGLAYEQPDGDGRGWRRSVSVTTERMYVAGVEWEGDFEEGHSTIQVVDISDPGGQLVEGASVEVEGQILSRWQMDEYEGVLRVVSQPGVWSDGDVPTVQTFAVVSSEQVEPLGTLDLDLEVPESLRAVRFDGRRAYAITAQAQELYDPVSGADVAAPEPPVDTCGPSCDPLFVIDLGNPREPVQLGELEMPGWVFHMEPRGDRLLALGFDGTYPLGSLNVSLFDVSDGTSPQLLDRVSFGGEWAGLAEDQNRIHKAFTIAGDLGLILVPYGWWEWQSDTRCDWVDNCGESRRVCWDDGEWARRGAVQLIDFTANTLDARDSAELDTWALRALVHDAALLAVSDDEVSAFDITDRDRLSEMSNLVF